MGLIGRDHLIATLRSWATVRAVTPERIEVTRRDGRYVTVVLTDAQYDGMCATMGLSEEAGAQQVIEVLTRLGPDERFAVYHQYRLEPATADTLDSLRPRRPPT